MAPDGLTEQLDEWIEGPTRDVLLLTGPARSGKTGAALEMYRRYLDETGRPRCLLIVPNACAAESARRRLLDQTDTGVLISPAVMTFAALGSRILSASGHPGAMISAARRNLLLRRIVDELHQADKLEALGPVAHLPGTVRALDRSIRELKRAAVEPDDLAAAIGRGGGRIADLVAIYRRYQGRLHDEDLYDVEGKMWQARRRLVETGGETPGLEDFEALAVDGFTDFTPTQLEILHLLADRLGHMLITLPYCRDGRERMWRWTRRTLGRIGERLGRRLQRIELPARPSYALGPVTEALFDLDARTPPPDRHISVIQAAGTDAELAAVARRIKRLLLDGTPAGRIAVIARSLEPYRPDIERIFIEHRIPVAEAPRPLPDVPAVRFAMKVAGLGPTFESKRVLAAINSSYFRPEALGPFDATTAATAQMLIRRGNVLAGRQAYAAAAERIIRQAAAAPDFTDDEEIDLSALRARPEQIRRALGMLEALFALADRAAESNELSGLIDALALETTAAESERPETAARDLRGLARLRQASEELASLRPSLGELVESLSELNCPPARSESLVDVLNILDARCGRWEHVFLIGCGEGQFPHRFVEGPLIGEAERRSWAKRGVTLDARSDLTAREMLLFYLAATRADSTLTLSFPRWDASGRDGAPGAFLQALADAAGGIERLERDGLVETIPPGRFVPAEQDVATERDALLAGLTGLFDREGPGADAALRWAVEHAAERLKRAAVGIWTHHRRWRPGERDALDGRIDEPALRDTLARRFGPERVFTATQLNTYGECPWRFFAAAVLGLEPLVEPLERLDPVVRGAFCHEVLFLLMQGLAERRGRPVVPGEIQQDDLITALDEAVEAASQRVAARGQAPAAALWQVQRRQMREQVHRYLLTLKQDEDGLAPRCLHFELRFGRASAEAVPCDPASTDRPVAMDTPAGKVRLAGRIDRIDRARGRDAEGLLVVDYKSGRVPTQADIDAGRALQLPIYVEAAEQILSEPSVGGAYHGLGNSKTCNYGMIGKRPADADAYRQRRDAAAETIGRFVSGIRAGRFDLLPTHDCPSFCPYRSICQFSPARADLLAGEEAAS